MAEDGRISTLRLRWRFFWSRRSHRRTSAALAFALVALVATIYLVLPSSGQGQVVSGLATVANGISSLGLGTAIALAGAICIVLSLILVFMPSYRRHGYLTTAPSIIPPVSVYLDAENQLSEAAIRPFTEFLIKHLDGRRADLLYFLDASQTANGDKYKTLYRFGFRPIDVPHDPTGKGAVKEAVDRELAMHAYERAVLGPSEQEFIIVTGDGDFVPLIYRLAALGHRIQIWAAPVRAAYRVVETYLGVSVIDLSQVISELVIAQPDNTVSSAPNISNKRRYAGKRISSSNQPGKSFPKRIPAPTSLSHVGEEQFYYAIAETLVAHADAQSRFRAENDKNGYLRSLLGGRYGPRLARVGYSAGNWLDYWLEHLVTLGVLLKVDGHVYLKRGSTDQEEAAQSLFAIARAAATAAVQIGTTREDRLVRMSEIAATLTSEDIPSDGDSEPLFRLVASGNGKRITHARYFVRSARALGLLEFEDVPESLDWIAHPRLPSALPSSADDAGSLPNPVPDLSPSHHGETQITLDPAEVDHAAMRESNAMVEPLTNTQEQTENEAL